MGLMPPLESVDMVAELVPTPEINVRSLDPELTVTRSRPAARGEVAEQKLSRVGAHRVDDRRLVVEEAVAEPVEQQDLVAAAVGDQEVGHGVAREGS